MVLQKKIRISLNKEEMKSVWETYKIIEDVLFNIEEYDPNTKEFIFNNQHYDIKDIFRILSFLYDLYLEPANQHEDVDYLQ